MIFMAKVCPKAINFAIAESIHQLLVLRPHHWSQSQPLFALSPLDPTLLVFPLSKFVFSLSRSNNNVKSCQLHFGKEFWILILCPTDHILQILFQILYRFKTLSYICCKKSCLSLSSDEFLRPMDHACGVLRLTTPSSGSQCNALRMSKCNILFRKVNQIMMASCCAPCVETCGNKYL